MVAQRPLAGARARTPAGERPPPRTHAPARKAKMTARLIANPLAGELRNGPAHSPRPSRIHPATSFIAGG